MPKFTYVAKDRDAHSLNGTFQAKDSAATVKELKAKGLTLISVIEEKEERKSSSPAGSLRKSPVKASDLVVFARLLATLIDSGVPLMNGFGILYEQVDNPYLKKVVSNLRTDIETGNSLSVSFAKYPDVFPPFFINMIKAGETSGSLNQILDRLADYMERSEKLKAKVASAFVYPAVVIIMAVLIMSFLILNVVPAFKEIFKSLGGELPLPTRILVALSDNSIRLLPFIIAVLVACCFAIIKYINTEKGRLRFDEFKLKIPVFGVLIMKVSVSRFASTLALLFKSGVNILEAFDIVAKVVGNKVFEKAAVDIKVKLQIGESISGPMTETKKFPAFVSRMIAVGEQTGELEKMLNKISEYYESQVNETLAGLTSILEPFIISFLGVTIGFIVLAMFMPIFKMSQMVNK